MGILSWRSVYESYLGGMAFGIADSIFVLMRDGKLTVDEKNQLLESRRVLEWHIQKLGVLERIVYRKGYEKYRPLDRMYGIH